MVTDLQSAQSSRHRVEKSHELEGGGRVTVKAKLVFTFNKTNAKQRPTLSKGFVFGYG